MVKFAWSALNNYQARVDSLVMEPASLAQDSTATTSAVDVSRQSILPFGVSERACWRVGARGKRRRLCAARLVQLYSRRKPLCHKGAVAFAT